MEVIKFDLNDPTTYKAALKDVYGLYVVTNWFEHMDTALEIQQAKSIAEYAASVSSIEHIIWSTTHEDTRVFYEGLKEKNQQQQKEEYSEEYYIPPVVDTENGYYIANIDGKACANQYFPKDKTTFLYTSMYAVSSINDGKISSSTVKTK